MTTKKTKKPRHGGPREGAGRPKTAEETQQVAVRFSLPLLAKIDKARGELTRSDWIRAAIEKQLGDEQK